MKQADRISRNDVSNDDNVRYKINKQYFNKTVQQHAKQKKVKKDLSDEDNILYKFPTVKLSKSKPEMKPKPKIKVKFWSHKHTGSRLHNKEKEKLKSSHRHTVGVTDEDKRKPSIVKVSERVSFLPLPVISDNQVPMVTVPDDLTIQFSEQEANTLQKDWSQAFVNNDHGAKDSNPPDVNKRKSKSSLTQTSPQSSKRKRRFEFVKSRVHWTENEHEYFSKYVVQRLRNMDTNQRIYSENLINTVLMLGQFGKLNGKSKINEA